MMATETELLIEHYNYLQSEIDARLKEIENLREMQEQTREKMPKLYFIEGTGQHGLAARIHFVGSEEECKIWVSHNPNLYIDGTQVCRKGTKATPVFYFSAGEIRSITPVDERWQEISDMAELGKQLSENRRRGNV
jgi:hypothetical protein